MFIRVVDVSLVLLLLKIREPCITFVKSVVLVLLVLILIFADDAHLVGKGRVFFVVVTAVVTVVVVLTSNFLLRVDIIGDQLSKLVYHHLLLQVAIDHPKVLLRDHEGLLGEQRVERVCSRLVLFHIIMSTSGRPLREQLSYGPLQPTNVLFLLHWHGGIQQVRPAVDASHRMGGKTEIQLAGVCLRQTCLSRFSYKTADADPISILKTKLYRFTFREPGAI